MDLRFTPEEDAFRKEVRTYLDELLHGEFAVIRGRGGPGDEHAFFDERLAWERRLGADGWTCVGLADRVRRSRPARSTSRSSTSRSTPGPAVPDGWATSARG